MSFSDSLKDNFGKIFDLSPFQIVDSVTDIAYVKKGKNIILGRKVVEGEYDQLLYLGKIQESAKSQSFLNCDVFLDTTFPHVIYITGTRGSGKSFDLGVLMEGVGELADSSLIQNHVDPISSILIDTQDQFWTLGNDPTGRDNPQFKVQCEELSRWKIKPNHLRNLKIFSPKATERFLPNQKLLTIRPRDVEPRDWASLFGQEEYSPQGHVISETIRALGARDYSIADILNYIGDANNWPYVQESTRNALIYRYSDFLHSGLFDELGMDISELMTPATCHVLMLRELSDANKSLVTAIVARNLFDRMGRFHTKLKRDDFFGKPPLDEDLPRKIWLFIDEAHVIAPNDADSPARQALVEYVKRGRDAGLSLVLATQQPAAIDNRILSQVNLSINHRLVNENDIKAATDRIPSSPPKAMSFKGETITNFGQMIRRLEPGSAFVSDSFTSRSLLLKIRPRASAHGGFSPI